MSAAAAEARAARSGGSSWLDVVRAELTKIITSPAVLVFVVLVVVAHAGSQAMQLADFRAALAGIDAAGRIELIPGSREPAVQVFEEQLVALVFSFVIVLPVLGALAGGAEFRSGELGISLAAVPGRWRFAAGKCAAAALAVTGACAVLAGCTTVLMFPVVAGWNPLILVSPAVLAGYGRVVFVAVCLTVIALGVTLAARRALAGVIVIGLVFFAGISQVLARVSGQLDAVFSPYSAARNMVFFSSPAPVEPPLTSGMGPAVLVLLAWAAGAAALGGWAVSGRDAR